MTATAARLAAALGDRYRVEREVGEGGMATVHLAEDLKHHRQVAIKVLHPELSAVIGPERFLKEIELTANLQHPHILPLYDSGQADGLLYYVMPYIEGETLRARLAREQQLPVADAIRIAREVADALEYAHRRSVVHRDIKPENILLQGGHALVADFGIALAVQQAGGTRMTQTGMSLGTPQYMAPEQAMAEKSADHRADIYALAAVTYEMLVGEPPFTGPSSQAIVAKVLTEDPKPLVLQRRSIPEAVEDAVLTGLEKLPADRFATAAEFGAALAEGRAGGSAGGRTRGRRAKVGWGTRPPSTRPVLAMALGLMVLAGLALWGWLRPAAKAVPGRHRVVLWSAPFPDFLLPGTVRGETRAAISPDGSVIAFADSLGDDTQLMIKRRDEVYPVAVPGTTGAISPFFSPDGSWIGYFVQGGRLRKVPLAGGGSVELTTGGSETRVAGAWLDDGRIIYVDATGGLASVPEDGGPSTLLRAPDARNPDDPNTMTALPDGRGVIFTGCPGNCASGSAAYVYDLRADTVRQLVANAAGVWYSPTGHLLYAGREGGLFAVRFDLDRLAVVSGAAPIADGVAPNGLALSASGTALLTLGTDDIRRSTLVWVARDGSEEPFAQDWVGAFEYPALSPDGARLAVSVRDGTTHLWVRGSDGSRIRLFPGEMGSWRPSWSPDGRAIAFTTTNPDAGQADANDVWLSPADGSTPPQRIVDLEVGVWEAELSRDGEWLVVRSDDPAPGLVRARRLRGDTTLRIIYTDSSFNTQVALAPDSRWLAFTSNRSGRSEVYVASFPDMQVRYPVSQGGGSEPRWARSGRELFFKSRGQLMSLPVAAGAGFAPGNARVLFPVGAYAAANNRPQYDVAPDGRRFLMIRRPDRKSQQDVVLVDDLFADIEARAGR